MKDTTGARIPFLDLSAPSAELAGELEQAALRVIRNGWYIGGAPVGEFEAAFAKFCGASHCVGVGNGLDALTLSLRALSIGPGDGVIVPSNTFIASWLAISAVGATPVPVEPDPATHLITTEGVRAAMAPHIRAIMPVHLYGQPVDLDDIAALAREFGVPLVEDAAQAHGARYKGQMIGRHGDAVCWSFYPGKNLGALGDGGGVSTNNADLAAKIRKLANYGGEQRGISDDIGVNSRLDTIQAAFLSEKLPHLEAWNNRRRACAQMYMDGLSGLQNSGLILPAVAENTDPAWHLFVIRLAERDRVAAKLKTAGIDTLSHYPIPPHMQRAYRALGYQPDDLPIARQLADEVLSLPIGPHLGEDNCARVIDAVRAAL